MIVYKGYSLSSISNIVLGVPLGAKYKDPKTWEPVVELFGRRLASWKRNFLSKGGRHTLIKKHTYQSPHLLSINLDNSRKSC